MLLLLLLSVFSFCLEKLELLEGRRNWILTLYVAHDARFVLFIRAFKASALTPSIFESTVSAVVDPAALSRFLDSSNLEISSSSSSMS